MSYDAIIVPGRICLLGDKIDLMGKPVIAAAISATLKIKFKKRDDDLVIFESKNMGPRQEFRLGNPPDFDHPLKYWHAILKRKEEEVTSGFEVIIDSGIPIGAGLSSSAAISVAFARALNHMFGLGLSTAEIAELAYLGEHDDLGIMCGRMDQYSIAFGGVTFIETGEVPKVDPLNVPPLPLVVGDSRTERKAKTILNRVKKNILDGDPATLGAFDKIHELVLEGKDALERGDFKRVGELMNLQQEQEAILKADTPKLRELCAASLSAGALGAKQMGAGGGGCMVAICPGRQAEVARAIEEHGGKAWEFDIYFPE
ncbi:MAG: mevalonate kinase family protein [Promethearchaeota archaeon]